ncbi:M61 family metallopeptidase [Sphingobium boeckii]|uniref:Putative metalloprotease with PDZ domain n=1 Tax=Sphingobium boeckii TaxID=1082345 RepID=A0A7W9AEL0_9SPHN|nr:PDZ domain-containing protein [Sphingobium boeckii]MBB5684250.1 putative metalloprotease with PDZ domain [Sphingobium boeckii]
MKFGLMLLPLLFVASPALTQNTLPQPAPPIDAIPAARDTPYPGTMTLDVDATDTSQAIFKVKQVIPVAAAGPMTLLFPKWLPGKHGPRGEIEKLAGMTISAGGKTIPWTRDTLDVYAFHIQVPAGAKQLDIAFEFLSATQGDQGRIVATPAMMNIQFEKLSLYPAGYFARRIPVRATVTYPSGWKAASGLPAKISGSTYAYEATDYETLIDSPVFAGRYFRQERLSPRVRLNIVADEAHHLVATPEQIDAHKRLVEQSLKLFGVQHYDNYEFLLALTDEMGGIGLEHHRSSENGVDPDYFTGWDKGPGRRSLLPHEFTHSWNGKFRRPAGNWTPDYRTPMKDDLLWVYEGQTQLWGYVLSARSGLFSRQDTLDALASIAATLEIRRGRDWRPLQDTTNDPVITPRAPKGWLSQQRSEDYYNEGLMIWLEADAIIRKQTRGRKGLDDFAAAFFGGRDGDWGTSTYEFADVVAALDAVTPYDWAGFLTTRVSETARGAPLGGLAMGGYTLVYGDTPTAFFADVERRAENNDLSFSLGLIIGKGGKVSQVIWDGPAFAKGLTVGDEIVAVNGRAYSGERIRDAIAAAKGTREPIRLLSKSGDRYREIAIDYHGGLRYPRLEKNGAGEGSLDKLLTPRN